MRGFFMGKKEVKRESMSEGLPIREHYSAMTQAFFGARGTAREGVTVFIGQNGNGLRGRRVPIGELTVKPSWLGAERTGGGLYDLSVLTGGEAPRVVFSFR